MRAAGFVEGYVTARRIADHLLNTKDYFLISSRAQRVPRRWPAGWVEEQDAVAELERLRKPSCEKAGEEEAMRKSSRTTMTTMTMMECLSSTGAPPRARSRSSMGISEGYRARRGLLLPSSEPSPVPDLSYEDLRFLNANGELYDVLEHFKNKEEGEQEEEKREAQLSGTGRVRAALSSGGSGKQQNRRRRRRPPLPRPGPLGPLLLARGRHARPL